MDKEAILNKYYKPKMHWNYVNKANVLKAMDEYAAETIVKKDEEIARLKADNEKYVESVKAMMDMSEELIQLRKFKEEALTNK